jgi:hypothetical protein
MQKNVWNAVPFTLMMGLPGIIRGILGKGEDHGSFSFWTFL